MFVYDQMGTGFHYHQPIVCVWSRRFSSWQWAIQTGWVLDQNEKGSRSEMWKFIKLPILVSLSLSYYLNYLVCSLYYPILSISFPFIYIAAEKAHDFQNPVEVPGQSGFLIRVGRWRKRYDRCKLLRGWFCVFKMGSGCGTSSKWSFLWLNLTTYKSWDDPPSIVKNFKILKMMFLFKKKQHRLCKPISRQICSMLLLVLMTLLSGHPKEASKDWKRLWKVEIIGGITQFLHWMCPTSWVLLS